MTLVVDASVVVAALIDGGEDGAWAERVLLSSPLAAPHLLPVEVTSILRRSVLNRKISLDAASMAHGDLLDLRVQLFPFEPLANRVWELRDTVSAYDAWYVSLAEALDADLATLDHRLTRATGPRCDFLTPGDYIA